MRVFLGIASGAPGIMLRFNGTADDWKNIDLATNRYVLTGWRDSLLAMTGYKSRYLPFEFCRRLAWYLGNDSGVFQGCVLHLTAQSAGCAGYDDTNLETTVPQSSQVEQTWMHADDDTTIYFPRSIDDMCSILNEDWNDAIIYLGSRFTEEQIVGVLKESEAGAKTPELCCKHGISPATFYKWKSKFGGLEVSDVAKMRGLEDENRRLKRLLADSALEIDALKLIASGNF
ncbi:MAG: transposase [Candidatus Eremiobacteraeota bacterium]|nr:transposase [Candidatus Eremiobacteraeota bacterium]